MPQPERVAHFMHRYELEPLYNEFLLLLLGEQPIASTIRSKACGSQRGLAGMSIKERTRAAAMASIEAQYTAWTAGESGHRLRCERFVFGTPKLQKVAIKNNVGIQYLAGAWVHSRRPHREPSAGSNPTKRVEIDIFRIPVGRFWLLPHLDRAGESGL